MPFLGFIHQMAQRIAFFNSKNTPHVGNIVFKRYPTRTQTNCLHLRNRRMSRRG